MIRVGLVGTSWWADSMYLPALADHPAGCITAVCGRDRGRAQELADRWAVPQVFTDWREMISSGAIDAVIVASANDTHHPITMAALDARLHVLCEKPIALDATSADEMADAAEVAGVVTMVPFTYHYMPVFREVKRLVDTGFVGHPYHLNLRYFTEFARGSDYSWRFDAEAAGSGVIGDLGTHWLHLAEWLLGPIEAIGATTATFVDRHPRPDGAQYQQAEDSAVMSCRFASGAIGTLQVCAVSYVGTPFGQTHHLDLHGSAGTVYVESDWDRRQEVRTLAAGEPGPASPWPISDESWAGVRRDTVHNTYRDVFRTTDAMTRGWLDAIADDRLVQPDLAVGARVQALAEAALSSAATDGQLIRVG